MAAIDPLVQTAARISELMNTKVESTLGIWRFRKIRGVKLQNSTSGFRCSLAMEVSFCRGRKGESTLNTAEVFLLSEEVSIFTLALRQQLLLFPTNYLQQITMDRGLCCLQLESLEPAEHFVERLYEAFRILKQQIPVITRQPSYSP